MQHFDSGNLGSWTRERKSQFFGGRIEKRDGTAIVKARRMRIPIWGKAKKLYAIQGSG